ncbi:MAG: Rv3235 family protein [Actinomycetes bacterium]
MPALAASNPPANPPEPTPPRLRLVPGPVWPCSPDRELDAPLGRAAAAQSEQPPLPLEFCLPSGLPAVPAVPELVVRHPRSSIVPWAARLAQAVLEVVAAERPVTQLTSWVQPEVYRRLERRHQLTARCVDNSRPRGRTAEQVRSVHVCHPSPEVAEVSIVTKGADRCRALALRLEWQKGRWLCTELDWA